MTRPDDWARVDYRSRAAAAICVIVTTLVTAVTYRISLIDIAVGLGSQSGANASWKLNSACQGIVDRK